jgi:hypothetical protein
MPRSCKRGTGETPTPQRDELEKEPLLRELRVFVEDSRLSRDRIARLMGVESITLNKWIDGTVEPHKSKLLDIKSFLWEPWTEGGPGIKSAINSFSIRGTAHPRLHV